MATAPLASATPKPYRVPLVLSPNTSSCTSVPQPSFRGLAVALLAPLFVACNTAKTSDEPADAMGAMANMSGMDTPVTIPQGAIYTAADVHFMQGMIAHHGQAIFMSRLATSHGANPRLQRFANKIDQSQQAEIRLMQDWLSANKQTVPDSASYHTVMMPGMLTAEQVKQLEAAKGAEFDKQFLLLMIQHHEGALKMVDDLLASPLAAQEVNVSVFANDVTTVQTAEIGVMRQMLDNL